ncbi:alpha/beta fold hydrolase [Isoptericola sp. NPDC019482]|uniref:alpha/beta fold hydrolase n=1 Tax=Isoptericola sp. NPDC019482 TaxID=3154688 RepID=UPI00347968A0
MPSPVPARSGRLRVDDGNELYYEAVGNPAGPAVLWLHGGPGSGAGDAHGRRIDPLVQQSIAFDQRGCGRSRPLATERLDLLDRNTTAAQIEDIEALRRHLGVERWTVTGASWGATLALAYAQAHPDHVTGVALFAVTNTSTAEVEWITEAMGRVFPEEWERFAGAVDRAPGERVVDAYARATRDPSPDVRARAAEAWGRWEDVHVSLGPGWRPDPRWQDPPVRDVLATLVTHYWSHSGFGGDEILGRMDRIAHLPGVLIHGRHDVSSPLVTAWRVHRAWPGSELVVLGDGHGGSDSVRELERTIARLAVDRP